jgi:hypothetical protein
MFATIRHHRVHGAAVDELADKGKTEFVPIIKEMPGLISYTIIAGKDMVSTVSIFESRAAAEESTRRAVEWAAQSVTKFDVPTEIVEGEVIVHEVP